MAGIVHKLLRKSSVPKIITTFNNNPQSLNLSAPLDLFQSHLSKIKQDDPCNLNPFLDSQNRDKINSAQALQIYPSFAFGYFLNPISPSGFDRMETEEVDGSGEETIVWADSVKKKRKKKMNKHKYKKLRKRLRRQT